MTAIFLFLTEKMRENAFLSLRIFAKLWKKSYLYTQK